MQRYGTTGWRSVEFLDLHRYRRELHRSVTPLVTRNLSTTAAKDCPHRAFARKYPTAATQILAVPNVSSIANKLRCPPFSFCDGDDDEALERYVEWRGWDIPSIMTEHGMGGDRQLLVASLGLLSHPLTFPLTLGRHWRRLVGNKHTARICCVGARAECTLPNEYWKELLIAILATGSENVNDGGNQCTIDFIGPDVPIQLKSKTITLDNIAAADTDDNGSKQQHIKNTLTMNFHSSILVESEQIETEQMLNVWDAFVIFNPGLGHPNLIKGWQPTIKFLLKTRRPMLLTAHSSMDAERDRLILEPLLLSAEHDSHCYKENPYASRLEYIDPSSKEYVHVIRPNYSQMIINQ